MPRPERPIEAEHDALFHFAADLRKLRQKAGTPSYRELAHALRETWRHRRGNTLTLAGYQAVGGIQHALAGTAETVYAGLDEQQRSLARAIFLRMVALGEGTLLAPAASAATPPSQIQKGDSGHGVWCVQHAVNNYYRVYYNTKNNVLPEGTT